MKKVKIGVLGAYRGSSMINYCKRSNNAEVVAICDKAPEALEAQRQNAEGLDIAYYTDFEDFIKHDMDAVVLANYANEHAPFAIRCMREGKHVFSEVLPVQTMKEAVELIEAVEETGKIYAYGENYCYMPAPYEMKKLYAEGKIGELEYAQCEYIHNCEPIWHAITYGDKNHWRNNVCSTFYCTHSIGPIIHASGLRPVCVIGMEGSKTERNLRIGSLSASFGKEIVTLENGAIIESVHGGLYGNSVWYSMYGGKGTMETGREADPNSGGVHHIFVRVDEYSGEYAMRPTESYVPQRALDEAAGGAGHGGSDFYCMYHFVEKIKGNPEADTIDVYEAMDMALPGLFAFRSILNDSAPTAIPNLRNKEEREVWRHDTACTIPAVAGDMLQPTQKGGTPEINDTVYELMKEKWEEETQSTSSNTYRKSAFSQGS